MGTLVQDIRYALRMMARHRGFAALAVIMLALGIGVTTTIFTAAKDFLLRPLPFANSDRLVMVKLYDRRLQESGWADPPSFKFWRDQNRVFEEMGAWADETGTGYHNVSGPEGPERVAGKQASAGFFRLLGVTPVLGRTFSPAEDREGGTRAAIISYALWQDRYGGNPQVLGKPITLDGKDNTIVGVLPAGFHFSTTPEQVWLPLATSLDSGQGGYFLNVIARLKPGVTLAQAQADMDAIAGQWNRQFPQFWSVAQSVGVESLRDRYTRDLRPALLALLAAAGLVLLIACANMANLLLARANARLKETAIRRALGAGRGRLIRQMMTESAVLGLLGGAGGLLIAFNSVRVFYAVLPDQWQPLARGEIDASALAFVIALSLVTVLLFGMAPAWSATGVELNEGLKEGLRIPLTGTHRRSFRAALIAGEIALAAMLLTGTGLLIRSFVRISAANMGFRPESVLKVGIPRIRWGDQAFYSSLLDRVTALPQVRAAGVINISPLSGEGWSQDITIEGHPPVPGGDLLWAAHRSVSPGYFRAMGIPLLKGRLFVPHDQDRGQNAAIISETMAKRYWPGQNPLGKRFGVNCARIWPECYWYSIVGVVGDVKELGATAEPATAMYFPEAAGEMTLVIRSSATPGSLAAAVRKIIHSIDPDQPLGKVGTMESVLAESLAPQRVTLAVAVLFAALSLLLAAVGIYGVTSYSVAQRLHELGVRMALGAARDDILKLVLGEGLRLALVGAGIGGLGALVLTRFLSSMLYGVRATDPVTFIVVTFAVTLSALPAVLVPARRAARIDPMAALRCE